VLLAGLAQGAMVRGAPMLGQNCPSLASASAPRTIRPAPRRPCYKVLSRLLPARQRCPVLPTA
jgi:hypothetical protein